MSRPQIGAFSWTGTEKNGRAVHEKGCFRGWEQKNEPAVQEKDCFCGRGPGYLLYLYDVIEMVTKKENQI